MGEKMNTINVLIKMIPRFPDKNLKEVWEIVNNEMERRELNRDESKGFNK